MAFPDDFRLPQEISLGHKATNEAIDLLCAGGVERLSLNKLADAANYSAPYFHKLVRGRAGMIDVLVRCFADRWERRVTQPTYDEDRAPWLPDSPGAVDGARCWHAMLELAYGEARCGRTAPARAIADLHLREQQALHLLASGPLGRRPTRQELLVIQMTLHGLRAAMSAPVEPLPLEEARASAPRRWRCPARRPPSPRSSAGPRPPSGCPRSAAAPGSCRHR